MLSLARRKAACNDAKKGLTGMAATTVEPTKLRDNALPHQPAQRSAAPTSGYEGAVEHPWLILLGLITAAIMQVLDTTIVNVALPQMAGNLGATNQEIGWVSTGYILSNVVVLPMTGFLTARFGRKQYLSVSILAFIIASFFCGTSHSLGELVFWRILQGIGGAALLATSQATLRQVFPESQQGMVQSIFLLGIIVAPTLGPTLGGWITDNYTWAWCFFINVPIGILSMMLVIAFLHDPPGARSTAKIDWAGIGLLAVSLSTMQYVLEEGQQNDWFNDPLILRLTVLSAVSLIGLLWWELSHRNSAPVVDFRVLKNRQLSATIVLFVCLGFALYGGTYLFPLFTQSILGFTSTQTGLTLLPGGMATALSTLICGRLLGPKSPIDMRLLIYFGIVIVVISLWDMGHMSPQSGDSDTQFALILRGFGLGFLFAPVNQAAFASLKPTEVQQGSGLINLSRQLGGSFGIAILGTYVDNQTQAHRADLAQIANSGNPLFEQRLHGVAASLMAHGYSASSAMQAAYRIVDQMLMRQAMSLAYDDAFMMILIAFCCVIPSVFILQKPKKAAAPAESHAAMD